MTAALDQLAHEIVAQARTVRERQRAYYASKLPPQQKLPLLDASKSAERELDRLLHRYDHETAQPSLF